MHIPSLIMRPPSGVRASASESTLAGCDIPPPIEGLRRDAASSGRSAESAADLGTNFSAYRSSRRRRVVPRRYPPTDGMIPTTAIHRTDSTPREGRPRRPSRPRLHRACGAIRVGKLAIYASEHGVELWIVRPRPRVFVANVRAG